MFHYSCGASQWFGSELAIHCNRILWQSRQDYPLEALGLVDVSPKAVAFEERGGLAALGNPSRAFAGCVDGEIPLLETPAERCKIS